MWSGEQFNSGDVCFCLCNYTSISSLYGRSTCGGGFLVCLLRGLVPCGCAAEHLFSLVPAGAVCSIPCEARRDKFLGRLIIFRFTGWPYLHAPPLLLFIHAAQVVSWNQQIPPAEQPVATNAQTPTRAMLPICLTVTDWVGIIN